MQMFAVILPLLIINETVTISQIPVFIFPFPMCSRIDFDLF